MKRLSLVIALFASASAVSIAQKQGQERMDSLLTAARHMQADTAGLRLMDAIAFSFANINPDEGLKWGNKALELSRRLRWKQGEAFASNDIGLNYQAKGAYPEALAAFHKALSLYEALDNHQGVGVIWGNIGLVYQRKQDYAKAGEYMLKSLKTAEETGDKKQVQASLANLGLLQQEQGKNTEALDYLGRALRMAEATGDKRAVMANLSNMGNTYINLRQYPEALRYSYKALGLAKEVGDKIGAAANLGNIGELYYLIAKDSTAPIAGEYVAASRQGNLARSIDYLQKGIEASRAVSFNAAVQEFSQYYSDALALQGDYRQALSAFRQYTSVKDSLNSIANNVKITNLETQREVELKNKQIELDRLAVAKKRNERGFFIVGIGLLLAVILVIFRNYRVQRVLNGALSVEKEKVERHTEELDATNKELNTTLTELKETQQQLIIVEKQNENEMIRSRISQDIHDDISSELTRISWVSELAKAKVKKADFGDMPGLLEKITDSSRETVTKLGEIIWTVNPTNDSLASLLAYMRNHITKFFADTAFQYMIDFPEEGTDVHINPELKRNLYLVMKEALNNVVKYSGATTVSITFSLSGHNYRFCIGDDGRGIEEGVVKGGGNGLGNMRRRMESVQGACEISSAPGGGTKVCCSGILN